MRLCWACWRRLRAEEDDPRTVVSPVDAQLLKSAIALCHPDRHPVERHDLCTRVTAALLAALKVRPRTRGGMTGGRTMNKISAEFDRRFVNPECAVANALYG